MKHYLYLFLIGVLSVLLGFQTCSKREAYRIGESNILAFNDTIKTYQTSIGQLVDSKRSITLQRDNFKFLSDSLNSIVKNFKKVDNIIEYKYVIKTDTVEVPIIINPDNSFTFKYQDDFISRSGLVYDKKVKLDPLEIYNTQSIITGTKKNGLFKRKEYTIDIHNTNPYIQSQAIQHYTIKVDKAWHEKWWISGPIGLGLGFLIAK